MGGWGSTSHASSATCVSYEEEEKCVSYEESTSHASSATISLKGRVRVTSVNHDVNTVLAVR